MKTILLLVLFLLPLPLLAQTTVRGIVTEQNSGNRPIPGVQIKALGCAPEASDNAGLFALVFADKKPGERIIISEVAKKGYEIVNKDVVANWVIQSDPRARTKIVMCPEGTLARNILRYYDISLTALTKGYNDQLRWLQAQRDSALIDARAFGEQANVLAERFENQQKQLEELAERFARENFDDCSEVHRRAFEAFSQGNVDEAIRILETVNSEAEIANAKAQLERGVRLEIEARDMQAQSADVIRQNIDKLMFQADLYLASNRYDDAEKAYETAARADTTYFPCVYRTARFIHLQHHLDKALRWVNTARAAARTTYDTALAMTEAGQILASFFRLREAENEYTRAVSMFRTLARENPAEYQRGLAIALHSLASAQTDMRQFEKAEPNAREALAILRELMKTDPATHGLTLIRVLELLGRIQWRLGRGKQGIVFLEEALKLCRAMPDSTAPDNKKALAATMEDLAQLLQQADYPRAAGLCEESLAIMKELAAANPGKYLERYAVILNNRAYMQSTVRQYDSSEANSLRALAIFEELEEKNQQRGKYWLWLCTSNLAVLYDTRSEYKKGEQMCRRSLALARELAATDPKQFSKLLALQLQVLGTIYAHDGRSDSAEALFDEALEMMRGLTASDSLATRDLLPGMLMETAWLIYPAQLPRAIAYAKEALGIYLQAAKGRPTMANKVSLCCNRLAKYMILSRQYEEAATYARMDLEYSADKKFARKNLAHSLLYLGRYEEARAIYSELKDEAWDESKSFREMFLEDLDEFEKAGVTHPDVAKIRALLNAT